MENDFDRRECVRRIFERRPVDRLPISLAPYPLADAAAAGIDRFLSERRGQSLADFLADKVDIRPAQIRLHDGSDVADVFTLADRAGSTAPSAAVDRIDLDGLRRRCGQGAYAVGLPEINPFNAVVESSGVESVLRELALRPENFSTVFAARIEFASEYIERIVEKVGDFYPVLYLSDVFAHPDDLSPDRDAWTRRILPGYARLIDAAHRAGARTVYNPDPCFLEWVSELPEIGADALHVAHFGPGMGNPLELKERYGDALIFHGGVDTARSLENGTPGDVRGTAMYLAGTLGNGGGLIVAPSHALNAARPENLVALLDAFTAG